MTRAIDPEGPNRKLILGSRGSRLALAQAGWVQGRLAEPPAGICVELKVVKTTGDKAATLPLASGESPGLFVREIEEELLAGSIDLAVHSLKDLPLDQPPGLMVAAVPIREDPRDVLVLRTGSHLGDLPVNAKVGTGSPRRIGQLLALREDLRFAPIRGNVDTRLRKLAQGDVDALVLALAGLNRIGASRDRVYPIPLEQMLPAPGQGALALEIRAGEGALREILRAALQDPPTFSAIRAERAFLKRLGGGCQMPVGALGRVAAGSLELQGVVAAADGRGILRDSLEGDPKRPEELGEELGTRMLASGASELLADPAPLKKA